MKNYVKFQKGDVVLIGTYDNVLGNINFRKRFKLAVIEGLEDPNYMGYNVYSMYVNGDITYLTESSLSLVYRSRNAPRNDVAN